MHETVFQIVHLGMKIYYDRYEHQWVLIVLIYSIVFIWKLLL